MLISKMQNKMLFIMCVGQAYANEKNNKIFVRSKRRR